MRSYCSVSEVIELSVPVASFQWGNIRDGESTSDPSLAHSQLFFSLCLTAPLHHSTTPVLQYSSTRSLHLSIFLMKSQAEEIHHFLSVFRSHETRPCQDQIVLKDRSISCIIRQKYDWKIALQPFLLVDRKLNLLFHQRGNNRGRNIEGTDFNLACF